MINCIFIKLYFKPIISIDNYSIILSNPPTIHSPTNKTKIIFTFINFILPELYHTEHPSHLIICAFSLLSTFYRNIFQYIFNTFIQISFYVTLPIPENKPAVFCQGFIYFHIPFPVSLKFF